MNKLFLCLALCLAAPAFAQSSALTNGQTAAVTGTNSASIAPNAVAVTFAASQPLAATSSRLDGFTKFETNQAATAPTIVGGAAPAGNGGCPAVEGVTGSIAVAQFGKTGAVELPGCMSNWLAERFASLQVDASGQFTALSKMKLEAWCEFPLYLKIINRTGAYTCKTTQDAQATPVDPYKAARGYP